MLGRYLPPDPHFSANLHFLTSESIEIGAGNARGRWIMLQASRYADGSAELIAARLTVDFAPAGNGSAWLIRHFRTERVLDGLAARRRATVLIPAPFHRLLTIPTMTGFIDTFTLGGPGPDRDQGHDRHRGLSDPRGEPRARRTAGHATRGRRPPAARRGLADRRQGEHAGSHSA